MTVTSTDTRAFSQVDRIRCKTYPQAMSLPPIRLVACIGVKSSPHLLTHFLEHYRRLGVDEFLIVLHAERGDARAEAAKERLAQAGIRPVREVEEYSATLKLAYTTEVVRRYCEPESWVVYADLDELQLYPDGLRAYLGERERRGHSFARGRLIDRLSDSGALVEIQPEPSLWEQFPRSASVTRGLLGGWDRKVCAARATVPIADGGAHAVRYGRAPRCDYRLTHYLPRFGERRIAIHHFKWDATLPQRVREKIEGRGGDLDRWHADGFMREYRRLDARLRRDGCIRLT
jgi:hypothetical protein